MVHPYYSQSSLVLLLQSGEGAYGTIAIPLEGFDLALSFWFSPIRLRRLGDIVLTTVKHYHTLK